MREPCDSGCNKVVTECHIFESLDLFCFSFLTPFFASLPNPESKLLRPVVASSFTLIDSSINCTRTSITVNTSTVGYILVNESASAYSDYSTGTAQAQTISSATPVSSGVEEMLTDTGHQDDKDTQDRLLLPSRTGSLPIMRSRGQNSGEMTGPAEIETINDVYDPEVWPLLLKLQDSCMAFRLVMCLAYGIMTPIFTKHLLTSENGITYASNTKAIRVVNADDSRPDTRILLFGMFCFAGLYIFVRQIIPHSQSLYRKHGPFREIFRALKPPRIAPLFAWLCERRSIDLLLKDIEEFIQVIENGFHMEEANDEDDSQSGRESFIRDT